MAFLALIPVAVAITEVVEAVAVVGAVATTAYVGVKTVEAVSDVVSRSSSSSPSSSSSSSSFSCRCFGDPPFSGRKETIYYWWGNGISYEDYEKLKNWGYPVANTCFTLEEVKSFILCEEKVGKPTKDVGYEPPRDWDGRKVNVPSGKGKQKGYPDKGGNVWVPKEKQHGGPGWEFQHKDGKGHHHVGKDGKVRTHWKGNIIFLSSRRYFFSIFTKIILFLFPYIFTATAIFIIIK